MKALALLPLPVLYLFSDLIAPVMQYVVKYRRKVVRQNLVESFPEKTLKDIKVIERKFYQYLCDQIVETLKLVHISDKEMSRRAKVINPEIVNEQLSKGRNVVLLLGHYGNWEWVQEISRNFIDESFMASIYHTLNNKTWNEIFIRIRSRWGAHIIEMKKAPRALLSRSNMPWVCGFIADQGTKNLHQDNKIFFLNHDTWFIYGPEEIGNKTGAEFFYLEMSRRKRGYYEIRFKPLKPQNMSLPYPHTREFWIELEKTIEAEPAYWLWSHRRWKFHPH